MATPFPLRCVRVSLAMLLMVALSASAAPATPPDDGSEAVSEVEFTETPVDRRALRAERRAERKAKREARREGRLRFRAGSRQFDLALRENLELLDGLPRARRARLAGRHELYAGDLEGRPGSWVRLARTDSGWKGLVFDGEELLSLEKGERSGLRLMRVADIPVAGSCGLEPETAAATGAGALLDELGELGAPPVAFAASGRLDIALIADTAFVAEEADPEGTALAILNAVDGLYAAQVGVSLRVVELQLLTSDAGLTSNDAGTLLGQLTNLTATGAVANPGLVHLLTGRSLDGSTVGIAYLEVLCNTRYGVGLSEKLSGDLAVTAVLVAHEIGHNFGAPHDNQGGSACSSAPSGHIMNPWLDAAADTFSDCSLGQMAVEIAGASCIAPLEEEPELPACSNGIDDDGDGGIDDGDVDCTSPDHPSELNVCRDGLDNDGDGLIDYPDDWDCRTADQVSEGSQYCGLGFESAPCVLIWAALRKRRRQRAPRERS